MLKLVLAVCLLAAVSALVIPDGAEIKIPNHIRMPKENRVGDDPPPDPEEQMSAIEMIEYFGYTAEAYSITTDDGYIIEFHRIPYGLNQTIDGPRTPVFVQHGLLCSSADWVINFPFQSLGFYLADQGYDVWLGNIRGNKYGRSHISLDPDKDDDFWHFSWDQSAQYEIPQQIDYVLAKTGYTQLYYVGHSMGTTMAFCLLSTKTEYNAKIRTFIAMGPVATLSHVGTPIKYLAPLWSEAEFLLELLGTGEFLPSDGVISWFAQDCSATLEVLCENILFVLCGYDMEQLNATRLDVYLSHTPAGTSTMTILHYAQEIDSGRFRWCDWGEAENYERYGQSVPPDYDVTLVTVPTALFWGQNDLLADPTDVDILSYNLPNLIGSYQTGDDYWAHMDFLWGIDTGTLVNPQAVALMPRF